MAGPVLHRLDRRRVGDNHDVAVLPQLGIFELNRLIRRRPAGRILNELFFRLRLGARVRIAEIGGDQLIQRGAVALQNRRFPRFLSPQNSFLYFSRWFGGMEKRGRQKQKGR